MKPRGRFGPYYRYYVLEADGSQLRGYTQRPAALTYAERRGFALYDAREKEIVLMPDTEKRLRLLGEERDELEARALRVRKRMLRIEFEKENPS